MPNIAVPTKEQLQQAFAAYQKGGKEALRQLLLQNQQPRSGENPPPAAR